MKAIMKYFAAVCALSLLTGCSSPKQSAAETESPTDSEKQTETEETKEPEVKKSYVLKDAVIVDNDNCTFTITDVTASGGGDVTFKVLCENKSDMNLMFAIENGAVNGYMMDPFWATTVAAGKKDNNSFTFHHSSLDDSNLESVDKFKFKLRIYDNDNWEAEPVVNEEYTVYPTGLSEDEIVVPERWKGNDEKIIVDENGVQFVILGTYKDDIWGYSLAVYLENNTDQDLMYSWDNVSVNGYMIDPFWGTTVTAGNKQITSIQFLDSYFEENNIETVENVEFTLRVHDVNDWMADSIVEDVYTYEPTQK